MTIYSEQAAATYQKVLQDYQSTHAASLCCLVAQNTQPLFSTKVGFADYATQRPFERHLLLPVASITKQFTAAAILLLHDDKKLELDKPIIDYLKASHPIWENKVPPFAHEVTIHQLLIHSSGIPSYTNEEIENFSEVDDEHIYPFIVSWAKNKALRFTVGEKFEYNNTGYLLLSAIIETVSGQSLSDYFATRFFQPLQMKQTFLPSLAEERKFLNDLERDFPYPARYIANIAVPNSPLLPMSEIHLQAPLAGAGALISTLDDLLKWNNALYKGKIVSPESFTRMTSIQIRDFDKSFGPIQYGYGLFIDNSDPNNVIYHHSGWVQGVRAELNYAPRTQTSVICFSNVSPDESQDDETQAAQVIAFARLAMNLQKEAILQVSNNNPSPSLTSS